MESKCTCMYLAHDKHSIPFSFSDRLECLVLRFRLRVTYSCPIQHTLCDNLRKAVSTMSLAWSSFLPWLNAWLNREPACFRGQLAIEWLKWMKLFFLGFVCLFVLFLWRKTMFDLRQVTQPLYLSFLIGKIQWPYLPQHVARTNKWDVLEAWEIWPFLSPSCWGHWQFVRTCISYEKHSSTVI